LLTPLVQTRMETTFEADLLTESFEAIRSALIRERYEHHRDIFLKLIPAEENDGREPPKISPFADPIPFHSIVKPENRTINF